MSIAHLDLKPENILYIKNPENPQFPYFPYVAKITDFGLSYFAEKDRLTDLYHGTEHYRVPEVI
jgi:serine/threonine protein kinase